MYHPTGGNERFVKAAEEFDKQHGGNPVFVGEPKLGGYYLYADGATRPYDDLCLAPGKEPPKDDLERKRLILKYYELHAQEAVKRFNKTRTYLEMRARHAEEFAGRDGAPMPPSEAEISKLTELQIEARTRMAVLARVREQLGNVEHPAIEGRQREADYLREVARTQAGRIEAIKL